jgi:Tol biopolymer transport system component
MRVSLFPLVIVGILFFAGCDLLDDNNPKPEVSGKIVFSTNEIANGTQIYKMNTDGSNIVKLTNFGNNSAFEPSWSPDGSKIVFTTSKKSTLHTSSIYLMNADGSNKRPMKINSTQIGLPYTGGSPVWSPDGSKIAFEGRSYGIFLYDFETDSVTRIANNSWRDRHPSWSPDGSKLAFSTKAALVDSGLSGFQQDIYTIELESGARTRITDTGNASYPNWSPDGRFISYQIAVGRGQAYLYDLETDSHKLLLPDFRTSGGVQWSKDGTMMFIQASGYERVTDQSRFYAFSEGKYELIHIELNPFKPARGSYKWYN